MSQFSRTLLFLLIAFNFFIIFKFIVLRYYTFSSSFQSSGYVERKLFFGVEDYDSYRVVVEDSGVPALLEAYCVNW